jgi:tetratricopeptide (TPR) repeat protein
MMNILNKLKPIRLFFMALATPLFLGACAADFLDVKPDQQMVVPRSMKDLRALLDNTMKMNISMPYFGETASDDQYLTYDRYISLTQEEARLAYIWQPSSHYRNNESLEWNNRYEQIFYCNIVLDRIDDIHANTAVETRERNEIKGTALFFRAFAYWQLAQLFCKPYVPQTAGQDLGLPLRLSSDINDATVRATVAQTWAQMIDDLRQSAVLLPASVAWKTRPTSTAAYALLARIYLAMGEYANAAEMAQQSLKADDSLIDYALLDPSRTYPIDKFNDEVLFHSVMTGGLAVRENRLIVDSTLFRSYNDRDYRKQVYFYFNDGVRYKGSYNGERDFFCGLTTSEMVITLAEAEARLGRLSAAMDAMRKLLSNRYMDGSYADRLVADGEKLLVFILEERRKELIFRGVRWTDLRRLNQDNRFAKTLVRILDGQEYVLEPNSSRYVFPIPQNVIDKTGIPQNE